MGWTFLQIDTLPDPGNIVWCRFPIRERPGQPGPWSRPSLVLGSDIHDDPQTNTRFGSVLVCYGTDLQKIGNRRHFPIATKARAIEIGLHKPTAFGLDGGSVKRLIWCSEFFVPPDYIRSQRLAIGQLNDAERASVRELLAKA